jgi:hypothetical protein
MVRDKRGFWEVSAVSIFMLKNLKTLKKEAKKTVVMYRTV